MLKIYDSCQQSEETISTREVIVRMLRSCCILTRGRSVLLSLGVPRTLALLGDASESVRTATCELLATLCSFPDVKTAVAAERAILLALVQVFLHDESQSVTDATVPALQQLTNWDPRLDEATLSKLAGVIVRTAATRDDRIALALLKCTLQVVWNCSLSSREKEVAITVGLVEVIAPLLDSATRDTETVRCASGVLASLTIAQRGKAAVIAQTTAVAQTCRLALDRRSATAGPGPAAVRANSVQLLRNIAEAPTGLRAASAFLVPEPETLLEVLGAAQTASALAPAFAAPLGAADSNVGAFDTNAAALTTAELLSAVRALHALIKSGPDGEAGAWRILDIVPRLYACAVYAPPTSPEASCDNADAEAAAAAAAANEEAASSIRHTAARCLRMLCDANEDARADLFSLGQRLGPEATAQLDVFAAVEGSYLKLAQAKQALESKQREEEEAANAAARAQKAAAALRVAEEREAAAQAAAAERAQAEQAALQAQEAERQRVAEEAAAAEAAAAAAAAAEAEAAAAHEPSEQEPTEQEQSEPAAADSDDAPAPEAEAEADAPPASEEAPEADA